MLKPLYLLITSTPFVQLINRNTLCSLIAFGIIATMSFNRCSAQDTTLFFNGTSTYVDLGNNVANGVRTIEMWFKPNVVINSSLPIFQILTQRNTEFCGNCDEVAFVFDGISQPTPGKLRFKYNTSTGFKYEVLSDSNRWNAGQWYHVAGVLDPVRGMRMYIDGIQQQDTTANGRGPTTSSTEIITLGCQGNRFDRFFNGEMNLVRFSTNVRYNSNFTPPCNHVPDASTAGLYFMDDNGSVLSDSSGNGYNGNIVNGTWSTAAYCCDLGASFEADTVCVGDSTSFKSNSFDRFAQIVTWKWFFGDGDSLIGTTDSARHAYGSTGSYTATLIVFNNNTSTFCSDTITQTVVVKTKPNIDLGPDTTLCDGQILTLNAFQAGSSYLWNDNSTSPFLSISNSGEYSVIVSSPSGACSRTDSIQVNFDDQPTVNLGNDTSLCEGDSIIVNAAYPGATYEWNIGSRDSSILINTSGTYSVNVTLGRCIGNDEISVQIDTLFPLEIGDDRRICDGDSITLNTDLGWKLLQWSTGDSTDTLTIKEQGIYWVNAFNGGCNRTDTMRLRVRSLPELLPNVIYTICDEPFVVIDAGNEGSSYEWSTGDTTKTISIREAGTYSLIITNGFGCSVEQGIVVNRCTTNLFVPNTITPNNDGKNDTWRIRNIEAFPSNNVQIYNRNGFLLFEASGYKNDWNGKYEGNELPATTYYYVIDLDDGNDPLTGTITILRED